MNEPEASTLATVVVEEGVLTLVDELESGEETHAEVQAEGDQRGWNLAKFARDCHPSCPCSHEHLCYASDIHLLDPQSG